MIASWGARKQLSYLDSARLPCQESDVRSAGSLTVSALKSGFDGEFELDIGRQVTEPVGNHQRQIRSLLAFAVRQSLRWQVEEAQAASESPEVRYRANKKDEIALGRVRVA